MTRLTRRLAIAGIALLTAACLTPAARAASLPDASEALAAMTDVLERQTSLSFSASLDFGGSAGSGGRQTLGTRVDVSFQRPDRLIAKYGEGGEYYLIIDGSTATLFRPSKGMKTSLELKPAGDVGGSAFAVQGLFVPFLGLLDSNVRRTMLGDVRSTTLLDQGTPQQPEGTVLVAILGSLFTGEAWISTSDGLPARIIGTFFEGPGGTTASADVNYSNWSMAPIAAGAFDVPGLQHAKEVDIGTLQI